MQPRVSVLLPTYNSARYLAEAIESVLTQTLADFELIIFDNASTDNTRAVVAPFLHDPRVSYYCHPENFGMVGNWNACLERATGDYLKFLMSDDKFHPELLERFVEVMEQYPTVSVVTSDRSIFSDAGPIRIFETPFSGLQPGTKVIYEALNSWNWIGEPTSVMFRRANLYLGNFNSAFKYYLDWDMWLRHLSVGDCYFIPEVLSCFRIHEGQLSNQLKQNYSLYFEDYEFYKHLKENKPYQIERAGFDPGKHLKLKSVTLFKVGLKMLLKGELTKWRIASRALRIGMKEAVLPLSFPIASIPRPRVEND